MFVVFIAAPYRGKTPAEVEANIQKVEAVAMQVAELGCMFQFVHSYGRGDFSKLPMEHWLEGGIELMKRSDFVLFLDGWEASSGCVGEHEVATADNMPIFYSVSELATFLVVACGALKDIGVE